MNLEPVTAMAFNDSLHLRYFNCCMDCRSFGSFSAAIAVFLGVEKIDGKIVPSLSFTQLILSCFA